MKFSDDDDLDTDVVYYGDNPELPIFSTVSHRYPASELARILMAKNLDLKHVQPLGVTKNATFVIDVDDVLFSDIKADDLGTWSPKGTKSTYFSMSNGVIQIATGKPTSSSYYINSALLYPLPFTKKDFY